MDFTPGSCSNTMPEMCTAVPQDSPNIIAASVANELKPEHTPSVTPTLNTPVPSTPKNKAQPVPQNRKPRNAPFSAQWTIERLRDQDPSRAKATLRVWAHPRRHREIDDNTIKLLAELDDPQALEALQEFRLRRTFIRKDGRKLSVKVAIMVNDKEHPLEALVASGCEGSCIHQRVVDKLHIPTKKLPRPIPVYNADGKPNAGGPITEYVVTQMKVGTHSEEIWLVVTDLGDGEIFLGHDWLKEHNPTIDWTKGTLDLDSCRHTPLVDPDADESEEGEQSKPEPGDRILCIDFTEALQIRAKSTVSTTLAEAALDANKKATTLPSYLSDYADVFGKKEFDQLPPRRPWDHAIEIVPDKEHRLDCKIYPLGRTEQEELDKFLDEQLHTGRIRPSKSPMASSFFFVKKKDGSLRPVQDYRKLNKITVPDRHSLAHIPELIDSLQRAQWFTKLDVRWGYNNIRIKEGDEYKAAFRTNRGLYEPLVMFFGLCNAPVTFQRMMNEILKEEIASGTVLVYMDDILIFGKDRADHRQQVRRVLDVLRQHKLYLKLEKCEFEMQETEYLGMIISEGNVSMDPVKVQGIVDWPTTNCKKDIQRFLGFCNFYRRFIRNYSAVARPLNHLTGNVPFTWTDKQQKAFEKLKTLISSAPVLAILTPDDPMRLKTDASAYAVGAVLSQKQDGQWCPVAFLSKSLTETQRNYEIYDCELLAIMTALEEFRRYLLNAKQSFEIWTDHANLQYFRKPQKLNRWQARWLTELQDYHFTLHHIPGKANSKADILSRHPGHDQGEDDNDDIILLDYQHFRRLHLRAVRGFKDELTPRILKALEEQGREKADQVEGWTQDDKGLWEYQGRIYIPCDNALRQEILRKNHDAPIAGHTGRIKTIKLVSRNYWWPTLRLDAIKYVRGCATCQRIKPRNVAAKTPLHPFGPPSRPWEMISLDLIGPLPESNGHNAILVIVDMFSKMIKLEPTTIELTAEGFAKLLRKRVFREHGLPKRIIHDRDPRFMAKYIRELTRLLGIKQNPSTAYHPQTDGQTERVNQEVEKFLRAFVNYRQDDWEEWLEIAEFSHNNRTNASTRQTPFFINYGQHPWTGDPTRKETRLEAVEQFASKMKETHDQATQAIKEAAQNMKNTHDNHARPAANYKEGNQVYLEATNIQTDRPSRKLDD